MKSKEQPAFVSGLFDGVPIMLGYLAVSFGFGIQAVSGGISAFWATIISATNLTSAGQLAGIRIISACGTLVEMFLAQLVINLRYSLMAISLSQNLSPRFNTARRMLCAYGITDEIFAMCAAREQKQPLEPSYMYGITLISAFGWILGTLLGAVAGNILPALVTEALGILLYGMFIAIIIPPARSDMGVLHCVLLAVAISCVLYYLLPQVSSGIAVIICALVAAGIMAAVNPLPEEDEA